MSGGVDADPAVGRSPRRIRILFLLPVLVFAGLVGLFAVRLRSGDPSQIPSALIGQPVPAFSLLSIENVRDAGGRPVPGLADADLRIGRVTVLNVWASWCMPCRDEHPVLLGLARDPRIRLVGIAYKDKPENARRFLLGLGDPYSAVGLDESGRTGIDLGVYGVPETFVIGPKGTIRYKHVGPLAPEAVPDLLREVEAAAR